MKKLLNKIFRGYIFLKSKIFGADLLFVDNIQFLEGKLNINGWALSDKKIDKIDVYLENLFLGNLKYGLLRHDIEKKYHFLENSKYSGFTFNRKITEIIECSKNERNLSFRIFFEAKKERNKTVKPKIFTFKLNLNNSNQQNFFSNLIKFNNKQNIDYYDAGENNFDVKKILLEQNCLFMLCDISSSSRIDKIEVSVNEEYIDSNSVYFSAFEKPKNHKLNIVSYFFQLLNKGEKCDLTLDVYFESGYCFKKKLSVYCKENSNYLVEFFTNMENSNFNTSSQIKFQKSNIDILIPIFNGFEYLRPLFESIYKNTLPPYRIIAVNDCSTDPNVIGFLEKQKKKFESQNSNRNIVFLIINNPENLGFVKSVNKAVELTNNHFVILNSDVEVPDCWLERLMSPIFEDAKIASTTPFTNSGTICSFPIFLKDNVLPNDITYNDIDSCIKVLSKKLNHGSECIEIPTGVGFCMGVNKNVVAKIGMFDEIFGKGYGEENDWCLRAKKAGFRNVAVTNLFVFHKNSGSFSTDEKELLLEKNFNILEEKHPEYSELIQDFIEKDPMYYKRDFLWLYILAQKDNLPVTVIIDHGAGGGANIYRNKKIEKMIKENMMVLLLTCNPNINQYVLRFYYKDEVVLFKMNDFREIELLFHHFRITEVFINELVFYENVMDVLSILTELKNQYKFILNIAIHDFFTVCQSYNFLNNQGKFCNIPSDISICDNCLNRNDFYNKYLTDTISTVVWRKGFEAFLNISDEILCFSYDSKNWLLKAYNSLNNDKIKVVYHEVDYIQPENQKDYEANRFVIAVPGGIVYEKGLDIIKKMLRLIKKRKKGYVKIVIFGYVNENLKDKNLIVTGKYNILNFSGLIEQYKPNLFFIPSIWPETFSYTTEEAMKTGLPVAVFNLGAQAERVKNYENGIIIDKLDAEYAFDKLIEWHIIFSH